MIFERQIKIFHFLV